MKLVVKLINVMKAVGYIQKTGFNKTMNYSFVKESDVLEKMREALLAQNVLMIPDIDNMEVRDHETKSGTKDIITSVRIKYTFYDGDSEETISFHMGGQGQDAGDKGVYKAITGATKYALTKPFLIPTGDDPEADEEADRRNTTEPQRITADQVAILKGLSNKTALTDVWEEMKLVRDVKLVTPEQFEKIMIRYDELK